MSKAIRDVRFRTAVVQEILRKPPPAIVRWGIVAMVFILGLFFVTASVVKFPVTGKMPFVMIGSIEDEINKPLIVLITAGQSSHHFSQHEIVHLHYSQFGNTTDEISGVVVSCKDTVSKGYGQVLLTIRLNGPATSAQFAYTAADGWMEVNTGYESFASRIAKGIKKHP